MDRRALLMAGGALAGSVLGGRAAHAVVQWPMFEWERPGVGVMVPPPLAVYGDGEAYADAAEHRYLPAQDAKALQDHAVRVLRLRGNARRLPDRDPPRDAPWDRVRVRAADGHYLTAHLDGWGDGDFPPPLHELYDHVQTLRRAVRATGEPWRPDAVLLVAAHLDVEPGDCGRWPAGVAVPEVGPGRPYLETKLAGAKARRMCRALPRSGAAVWPCYRTPAGTCIAANWRYRLPHEW